jgi:cytochrome o ubiquinol oxidase subunit 1
MPKNTASGIYISIFAFLAGFAFVWHITWLIVASLLGIIIFAVARTFDEHTEYTLTAEEVENLEKAREKKALSTSSSEDDDPDKDMGLWEFVKVVLAWAWDIVRNKRWRTW